MGSLDCLCTNLKTQILANTMARYKRKRRPVRRTSTYRKRKSRRSYGPAKRARRTGMRKRTIGNRVMAIQRATFSPQSKMVQFVFDQTYVLHSLPAQGAGKTNSYGLAFCVNDIYNPAYLGAVPPQLNPGPYWGACTGNTCGLNNQVTDGYEGTRRWLSTSTPTDGNFPAPYRRSVIKNVKVDYRCTPIIKVPVGGTTPTDPAHAEHMVQNIGILCGFRASHTAHGQRCSATNELYDVEEDRHTKRYNMRTTQSGSTDLKLASTVEQVKGTQNVNAKMMYQFKDWADKRLMTGQVRDQPGQNPGEPELTTYWHIGFYDRYPNLMNEQWKMPDMEVRIKLTAMVELTMPNSNSNHPMQ